MKFSDSSQTNPGTVTAAKFCTRHATCAKCGKNYSRVTILFVDVWRLFIIRALATIMLIYGGWHQGSWLLDQFSTFGYLPDVSPLSNHIVYCVHILINWKVFSAKSETSSTKKLQYTPLRLWRCSNAKLSHSHATLNKGKDSFNALNEMADIL